MPPFLETYIFEFETELKPEKKIRLKSQTDPVLRFDRSNALIDFNT